MSRSRVVVLALLLSSSAAAAPSEAARAKSSFEAGVAATKAGAWTKARELFRESYGLLPRNSTLVNWAGSEAHTGELVGAADHYRAVLQSPEPIAADVRQLVEDALVDVERRSPKLAVRVPKAQPGDVARMDDRPVSFEALATPHAVNPGLHAITVRRSKELVGSVDVVLAEAETRQLELAVKAPRAEPASPREAAAPARWYRSPWLWTAVGVIVVGGASVGICAAAGCFGRDQAVKDNGPLRP